MMVKMCGESGYPLKIIFETALKSGIYPDKWKKANVVPVHKKESKNMLKNYIDQYYYYLSREIYSDLDACLSLETKGVFF